MAQEIYIDALGMRCPRPIVEVAKAKRRANAGDRIVVVADDLAFESDIKAWCETTGNALEKLDKSGATVTATIRIAGEAEE